MPIGTGDGEFFDDEFHYQSEGFTPMSVTSPVPSTDSFQPGPPTSVAPTSKAYEAAKMNMDLNPQEQMLYERHLTNLNGSGGVDNPDGSRSTLFQAVEEHEGKFYNIPTVWGGKIETEPYTRQDGTTMQVPNAKALSNVGNIGWNNFPSYKTPDEADERYEEMHKYMEQDTKQYLKSKETPDNRTYLHPNLTGPSGPTGSGPVRRTASN